MDFSIYSREIQELAEKISRQQSAFSQDAADSSEQMLNLAGECGDDALIGWASYNYACALFAYNYSDKIQELLRQGMICQRKAGQAELLARSYNMLGIIEDLHGRLVIAVDYYLTGLDYCHREEVPKEVQVMILQNLAQVYAQAGRYDEAIAVDLDAYKDIQAMTPGFNRTRNLIATDIMLGFYYCHQNKIQDAEERLKNLEEAKEKHDFPCGKMELLDIAALKMQVCWALGDKEESLRQLDRIKKLITEIDEFSDIFYDIMEVLEFCLKVDLLEKAEEILEFIAPIVEKSELLGAHLRLERIRLAFAEKTGNRQMRLDALENFYTHSLEKENDDMDALMHFFSIRRTMDDLKARQEKMRKENEELEKRADHDALTGIANRYALNNYADQAFDSAYKDKKLLAIGFIDMDNFKQLNDSYGHLTGDECLKKAAGILDECCREYSRPERKCCAFRYGGDEFLLILGEMDKSEIGRFSSEVAERAAEAEIPAANGENSGGEPVRVAFHMSQGYYTAVPHGPNRLWDFMGHADRAVYDIKKSDKGGISILTRDDIKTSGN